MYCIARLGPHPLGAVVSVLIPWCHGSRSQCAVPVFEIVAPPFLYRLGWIVVTGRCPFCRLCCSEISRFAVALGFSLSGSLKLSRSGTRRINEFQMGSVGWLLVHYLAANVLIGLYPLSLSPSVFDLSSGRCPRAISISNFSSFLIPSNCGPSRSPIRISPPLRGSN